MHLAWYFVSGDYSYPGGESSQAARPQNSTQLVRQRNSYVAFQIDTFLVVSDEPLEVAPVAPAVNVGLSLLRFRGSDLRMP